MKAILLLTFLSLAHGVRVEVNDEPNRPTRKVVLLIQDMLKTLNKEAEEDQAIYDKLVCWCETYDQEKTKAIAQAEADIKSLTASIEEGTAKIARLSEEIAALEAELAENEAALEKATALRSKELKEFNEQEASTLSAISAMKEANKVLSKHHGGASLLQVGASSSAVVDAIHLAVSYAKDNYVPLEHKRILNAFLAENGSKDFLNAEPTFKESYAPQSGQIFGILQQMQETFETNLSDAEKAEVAAQAAFEKLRTAKRAEIKAGQEQIATKKAERATAKEKLEEEKITLEDTKNQLSADEKFLVMLKEKCSITDAEWDERQKARALEIEACSKALAILNSDDARDTFTSTFNVEKASFLQTSLRTARNEAAAVLNAVHSPKLAALALKVKLDAFEKVKAAIDAMIADLNEQQVDEQKQKDWCVAEINDNEAEQAETNRSIIDSQNKIDNLIADIDLCTKTIAENKQGIAETQTNLKRAGENREAENAVFQNTVRDQKASLSLLNQALDVMEKVYAGLLQQPKDPSTNPAGPAPPPGFKEYKKNEQGSGVVQMIKAIIQDAEAMLVDATKEEAKAQESYETVVAQGNADIEEKTNVVNNQNEAKAGHEVELIDTQKLNGRQKETMKNLEAENEDLHKSCDYLLKNFDVRQELRQGEIDALTKAKAILSGAKFD